MKPVITREAVADAIKKLTDAGQKPTLAAIHAALGGKGSISTLIKLKAEIESQATAPQDSAESLTQFRALWAVAVGEGRKQAEAQLAEIRAGLDALSAENERLEASAIADAARVQEMQAQRDKLVDELSQANKAATEARAAGEQHATKLAAALDEMAQVQKLAANEWKDAHQLITKQKDHAHALEIERATLLEKLRHLEGDNARLQTENDATKKKCEVLEVVVRGLETKAKERDALEKQLSLALEETARLSKPAKKTKAQK